MSTKLNSLESRLGASWASNPSIIELFESPMVKEIAKKISEDRKHNIIYPIQDNVFRAFRETPLSTVKVVFLLQDPYPQPGQATGLAMDCGVSISPTIEKILEQYEKEYPKSFATDLMQGHLIRWAHQGVFLYNAALTVVKDKSASHMEIWKPFTKEIIKILIYDQNPKVFVGMGKFAQDLLGKIPGPHTLITCEHPVFASYQNRDWDVPPDFFHRINEIIRFYGRPEINW